MISATEVHSFWDCVAASGLKAALAGNCEEDFERIAEVVMRAKLNQS